MGKKVKRWSEAVSWRRTDNTMGKNVKRWSEAVSWTDNTMGKKVKRWSEAASWRRTDNTMDKKVKRWSEAVSWIRTDNTMGKKGKKTNSGSQNTTEKTKDWAIQTKLDTECCGRSSSFLLVQFGWWWWQRSEPSFRRQSTNTSKKLQNICRWNIIYMPWSPSCAYCVRGIIGINMVPLSIRTVSRSIWGDTLSYV